MSLSDDYCYLQINNPFRRVNQNLKLISSFTANRPRSNFNEQ